jgi:hypothetical protein
LRGRYAPWGAISTPSRIRPASVPTASGIRPDTCRGSANALHTDGLGSVRAVTDAAGLTVERTTYRRSEWALMRWL